MLSLLSIGGPPEGPTVVGKIMACKDIPGCIPELMNALWQGGVKVEDGIKVVNLTLKQGDYSGLSITAYQCP